MRSNKAVFTIYSVYNVDEALSLLMNREAGAINAEGQYPEGSINFKAVARLKEISDMSADDDKESDGA